MNQITKISNTIIREAPIQLIFKITAISIIFNVIYAIVAIIADNSEAFNNESIAGSLTYDTFFLLLFIVIQLLIVAYLITIRYSRYYKLEEEYILHKTWILTKKETRFKIDHIRSINIRKWFRGNILQFGDIEITTQADGKKVTLDSIPNPEQLVYFIGQIEHITE